MQGTHINTARQEPRPSGIGTYEIGWALQNPYGRGPSRACVATASMSTIALMGLQSHPHFPAVQAFWRSERIDAAKCERVLPTGQAQVIVDLDTGDVVLVGPRTLSAIVTPARFGWIFVVGRRRRSDCRW